MLWHYNFVSLLLCLLIKPRLSTHPCHHVWIQVGSYKCVVACVCVYEAGVSWQVDACQVGKVAVLSEGLHNIAVSDRQVSSLQHSGLVNQLQNYTASQQCDCMLPPCILHQAQKGSIELVFGVRQPEYLVQ